MNIGKIKINKGFFYGAGSSKVYNWAKDGYHIHGVGVETSLLPRYDQMEIEVDGRKYSLDCIEARLFAHRYHSYKTIKGVQISVISRTLLKELN